MSENLWYDVISTINRAGQIPMPPTDTILEIMKTIISEEQAEFLLTFRKPLNMEELMEVTGKDKAYLDTMLNSLMDCGVVTGFKSRTTGTRVYRLIPILPGILEFTLMRGETGPKERKLAVLFDKLFTELSEVVQVNYDAIVPAMRKFPAADRIIPVTGKIEGAKEEILPAEEVEKIIDKFDTISVATCYCRHEKDLLNDPCKFTKERENCLMFGPAAEFTIDHNFARPISKEEAKKILKASEDAGLVHKSFHAKMDPERDQDSICSCCKCCCGTFQLYSRGGRAMHSYTSFMAEIIDGECMGCANCISMCPMDAISLKNGYAVIEAEKCLGCGICAHHCDFDAIKLNRTGLREVFVPPPRLK